MGKKFQILSMIVTVAVLQAWMIGYLGGGDTPTSTVQEAGIHTPCKFSLLCGSVVTEITEYFSGVEFR